MFIVVSILLLLVLTPSYKFSVGMKNGANHVFKRIEPFITHLFKPQNYCKQRFMLTSIVD